MDVIKKFSKGKWLMRAALLLKDPQKTQQLLAGVKKYTSKEGLTSVKDTLVLMYEYVRDCVTGKYKGYSLTNLTLIVAPLIYLVAPIDAIPDILPAGLIDDVAIIFWTFGKSKEELEKYKEWREE